MKSHVAQLFCIAALLAVAAMAQAQDSGSTNSGSLKLTSTVLSSSGSSSTSTSQYRGFNAYESLRGVVTSSDSLLKLDSSVGYDFNRNFGIFAGIPVYMSNSFGGGSNLQEHGIGDVYFGAEVYVPSHVVRYSTTVTVAAPTGNVQKGFSSGEVTVDWTNRFRHSFGRLTPSFSAGVGNSLSIGLGSLPSSDLTNGALSSVGTAAHLREGAEFDLTRRVYLGAAGYQILPFGNNQASSANATNLVRETGVDTWFGFEPSRVVRMEIGYSRSTTFALNSLSFNMGFNVGRMLRSSRASSSYTK
jgi:hypothetical protein